jgi:TonB family protein
MKPDENEKKGYSRTLILVFLLLLSLLLHLLIFGTFLKFGFQRRAKALFASVSQYLTPTEQKQVQKKIEQQHAAFKKIFQKAAPGAKQTFPLFKKENLQDTRPAKLVAPKSNFGWVLFDNEPQKPPEKLEIPTTKQDEVGVSQLPAATEIKPQIKPEKESVQTTLRQAPDYAKASTGRHGERIKIKTDEKSTSLEKPKATQKSNLVSRPQTNLPIPVRPEAAHPELVEGVEGSIERAQAKPEAQPITLGVSLTEEAATLEKRIEEIERLQKKIESYAKLKTPGKEATPLEAAPQETQPQETPRELTEEEEKALILRSVLRKDLQETKNSEADGTGPRTGFVWGARSNEKKDGRNIINLTKGYVEKLRGENGTDLIDRDGDPNKKPNFEELKYISYESKINWCLQSSWKQNFAHNKALHFNEGKAIIEFTLDEKGYITNSKMLQPTGSNELDNAILKNLEFASPFPPLPKHFGTKTYTTGRIITVYAHQFGM